MSDRPDLVALRADPARVVEVPSEAVPGLLAALAAEQAQLAALEGALAARLATTRENGNGGDHLLTVAEAAKCLRVPQGWLKKRADLPFRVVLSEGTVRYSAAGIDAHIRAHSTG